MMEACKVLVVGMTDQVGGLETFVMNYCECLSQQGLQFDFLCRFPQCSFAERIEAMGGKIYHVTRRSQNPIRFYREIKAFFSGHASEYDVIWDNECMMNDLTPLLLARKHGIPRRIYHSHNSANMDPGLKGRLQALLHRLHRLRIGRIATDYWACSETAAHWAFPKTLRTSSAHRIIHNAIPLEQYQFDPDTRQAYRSAMGLQDKYVVGHVGRLQYQKNQSFLLEVFALLRKECADAVLMLVGDGPDKALLQQQTERLGIASNILFLGLRKDVAALLQAMDVFVLPSRFEGLSIAAIEAQASGLPCVMSDSIAKETKIAEQVYFVRTNSPKEWCETLKALRSQRNDRKGELNVALTAGYNIRNEQVRLMAFFKEAYQHE